MTGYQAWASQFADVVVTLAQYEALSSFERDTWERIARDSGKTGADVRASVPVEASFVDPYASTAPLAALPLPVNEAGVVPAVPIDPPKDVEGKPALQPDLQPALQPGVKSDLPLQTFPKL
jgi:hypothetical protein